MINNGGKNSGKKSFYRLLIEFNNILGSYHGVIQISFKYKYYLTQQPTFGELTYKYWYKDCKYDLWL